MNTSSSLCDDSVSSRVRAAEVSKEAISSSIVFYTSKTTPKPNLGRPNNEYSRLSREVVRGGLSGQRTDHNCTHTQTIPGYCTLGLAQAT